MRKFDTNPLERSSLRARWAWGITPFQGNYYIRRKYLRDGRFRVDYIPGLCVYKGLYVGLNYVAPDQTVSTHLGWLYWLPNPLLPFVMFRVAVPGHDPRLAIEPVDEAHDVPAQSHGAGLDSGLPPPSHAS
ncbi:MAG: hypothetical protein ACREPF_00305 [Rhodanobacteraceae bacterium]